MSFRPRELWGQVAIAYPQPKGQNTFILLGGLPNLGPVPHSGVAVRQMVYSLGGWGSRAKRLMETSFLPCFWLLADWQRQVGC